MRRMGSLAAAHGMVLFALVVLAGCSLSTSANMGSDSSESSESSSRSSASSAKKVAYRDDVRSYTVAFATSGAGVEAFESRLGALARAYGVTNWEEDQLTYLAIGEGLASAGVSPDDLVTYKTRIARADPRGMETIQQGFDARP